MAKNEIERAWGKIPFGGYCRTWGLASVYVISLRTYRKGLVQNMGGGHGKGEI